MNQPIASESALSAFLHNLPDTLRQPFSLAVIGSVGAHLFFFLWLPLFTTEEAKPDNQRVVRLLNSSNSPPQSQVATSQLGLPPIPKTPTSTVKIPLGQLTPPIPPDSSLYKFQDPIGPFTSPIVPPAPPVFRFPQPTNLFSPPPIPQNFNRIPNSPRSPSSVLGPIPIQNSPTQNATTTPPPPLNINGQTDRNVRPLTPGVTVNSPTQPTNPATPQNQTAAPTATVRPELLAENQRLRDKFTFKSPGATPNEVDSKNLDNYISWYKANVTDRGIQESPVEKRIVVADIPYNSSFNLTEKVEPAYIHVLVAPDGNIVTRELAVTGRTGYGILDDLAVREVFQRVTSAQKEGTLKPTGDDKDKYVIYIYKVTFKIDRAA